MIKNNLQYFIAIAFLLSACSKNDSSLVNQNNQISGNIMGGVVQDSHFQNQSGVVGLLLVGKNSAGLTSTVICTGTLIAPNVVLSAGHCVDSNANFNLVQIYVAFDTDIKNIIPEIKSNNLVHIRKADAVIQHEGFGFDQVDSFVLNDLSLIRFSGLAPTGFNIAKVPSNTIFDSIKVGTQLSLAGYGVRSYNLDSVTKKPVGVDAGKLRSIDNRAIVQITADHTKFLFNQQDGKGACHGDSGGPAFFTDAQSNQTYIVGVTSQGYWVDSNNKVGDPLCNQLNVYTNLSTYTDWIAKNLEAIKLK